MQTQSSWSSAAARCWNVWCGFCSLELRNYFWSILVLWWSNYFTFWNNVEVPYLLWDPCFLQEVRRPPHWNWQEPLGALGGGFFCLFCDESKQFWYFTKPSFSAHGGTSFPKAVDTPSLPSKYCVIKIILLLNEVTVGPFLLFQYELFRVLCLCQEVLNTSHLFNF